jgi:hypothetical protein
MVTGMKTLPVLLLLGALLAGCSAPLPLAPAAQPPGAGTLSTPQNTPTPSPSASAGAGPGAVTVRPPLLPVEPVQTEPPSRAPTLAPTSSAGWQAYTNAALRVALAVPAGWAVDEQGSRVLFSSPQGGEIELGAAPANSPSASCTGLINSAGLSLTLCLEDGRTSAAFEAALADGTQQRLALSTRDRAVLDVYKAMLETLRVVP